jgi:hypothetical protein
VAVYTQPDRPAGRGQKLMPSAVKHWPWPMTSRCCSRRPCATPTPRPNWPH